MRTFEQFCDELRVRPDERDQLAWFLGQFRARKTYEALRREPVKVYTMPEINI